MMLATIVDDPSPTPGAVPRDPDDDKIVACAVSSAVFPSLKGEILPRGWRRIIVKVE
jgi:hypothetical protein